jgi:hypothetical protein
MDIRSTIRNKNIKNIFLSEYYILMINLFAKRRTTLDNYFLRNRLSSSKYLNHIFQKNNEESTNLIP